MTPEQFWDGDCTLAVAYRKAFELKQDLENQQAWLQGMYIYDALCCVAPVLHAFAKNGTKPTPFRKEPYPLSVQPDKRKKEIVEAKSDAKAKAYMEMFMTSNNKKFQ
jgi:hypothetical protein